MFAFLQQRGRSDQKTTESFKPLFGTRMLCELVRGAFGNPTTSDHPVSTWTELSFAI